MKIESDSVYAQDVVFSDRFGIGRVTVAYPTGCFVQFSAGAQVNYADGGMRNGRRELHWAEPIVITARKKDRPETLQQAQKMAHQILELARG